MRTRRPQRYEHSARSCIGGAPTRAAASAAGASITPRRDPGISQGLHARV
jgi:hypothetical protein